MSEQLPAPDDERRQKLAALRRQAGFSQDSLAERLQASRSSIYRWERGEAVPQPRLLALWAEALGIETDELDDLLWSGDAVVRPVTPEETGPSEVSEPAPEPIPAKAEVPAGIIGTGNAEPVLLDHARAVATLLGLDDSHIERAADLQVAVALSSFRGALAIDPTAAAQDLGGRTPASFVQAYDDIANDYFFGKRDVLLANQITGALTALGFPVPIYVEDRSVWRQLTTMEPNDEGRIEIIHEGEAYELDVLVVAGLWSNVLATGLADWEAFPEYQMAGDPASHATRTIRIATAEGLRIIDLNSSDETEEMGGNPAIIFSRELHGLHLVVVGGATSLSTLRLAELLANPRIWSDLAVQIHLEDPSAGEGGSWVAIECPNAARWKDRCRVVSAGKIQDPIPLPLTDVMKAATT